MPPPRARYDASLNNREMPCRNLSRLARVRGGCCNPETATVLQHGCFSVDRQTSRELPTQHGRQRRSRSTRRSTDALINTQDFQEDLAEEFNDPWARASASRRRLTRRTCSNPSRHVVHAGNSRRRRAEFANTAKTNTAWRKQSRTHRAAARPADAGAHQSRTQPRTYQTGGISAASCHWCHCAPV